MKMKHLGILTLVFVMMVAIAGAVSAQGGPNGRGGRGGFNGNRPNVAGTNSTIITDATGLTQEELRDALMNGSTIAELIEANGGDVDAVIADLVAQVTENLNERNDATLETLEDRITEQVNGTYERPENSRVGFGLYTDSTVILDATGLTQEELRDALRNGSTIAELIEANDGDVSAVIADLVDEATTAINEKVDAGDITQERADTYLENLEERITERINGTYERSENGRGGRGFDKNNSDSDDTTPTDEAVDEAETT